MSVTGYAAAAENMPGGGAQRPADVITIYGGKTVEVLDTDAEGRLVLADALVRAQEDQPDVVVDIATLTGAQVVALGSRTAGSWPTTTTCARPSTTRPGGPARRCGRCRCRRSCAPTWTAPPVHANIPTVGRRDGGMLTAGVFLREFIRDGQRWAHLDIAGPAFNDYAPYGYVTKGGTGMGVRTFIQLAEDLADGSL